MDFVAIDVETANPDLASICQVGVAIFRGGQVEATWSSLVDPQDYFDPMNVAVHGIEEASVYGAPKWADVHTRLHALTRSKTLVCHTPFDRSATQRASELCSLPPFDCQWLDTARVARRAWPQFAKSGYGLKNVAEALGVVFRPHDALEDARAAGEVLCHAITATGLGPEAWCGRIERRIDESISSNVTRAANPEGPLFGHVAVFTGALSIPRQKAADLAAAAGCVIGDSVNKKTTLLVVGDQDIRKLGGKDKSSKHLKAEQLITAGHAIRILGESDFERIVLGQGPPN